MNSEITNNEEKNEWPKLMESMDGTIIILSSKDNKSVVLHSTNERYPIGFYTECVVSLGFKPFTGKITLWN